MGTQRLSLSSLLKFGLCFLLLTIGWGPVNAWAQPADACGPAPAVKAALDQLPEQTPALTDWQFHEQSAADPNRLLDRPQLWFDHIEPHVKGAALDGLWTRHLSFQKARIRHVSNRVDYDENKRLAVLVRVVRLDVYLNLSKDGFPLVPPTNPFDLNQESRGLAA